MTELTKLTSAELNRLAKNIEKEIAKRSDATKSKVMKAVAKLAKEAGIEVSELLGARPAAKRANKATAEQSAAEATSVKPKKRAKFQNPADPKQRWTGHGRRPAWVLAHQAAGGSLDDLRIGRAVAKKD